METLPLTGGLLTIPLMLIGFVFVAIGAGLSRITGRARNIAFDDRDQEPTLLPVSWRAGDVETLDPSL